MAPIPNHTVNNQKGDPSDLAMAAGVRKIPTPIASPATAAAAEPNPSWRRRPAVGVVETAMDGASAPITQNAKRTANWKARGPPEPKKPPAVLTPL